MNSNAKRRAICDRCGFVTRVLVSGRYATHWKNQRVICKNTGTFVPRGRLR